MTPRRLFSTRRYAHARAATVLATVVLGGVALGCGTEATAADVTDPAGERVVDTDMGLPHWVDRTPSEPGEAFYGVGTAVMTDTIGLEAALAAADAQAKANLEESILLIVERAYRRYIQAVLPPEVTIDASAAALTIVELLEPGIIKQAISGPVAGERETYSLGMLPFQSVTSLAYEKAGEFHAQMLTSGPVFDELDALLLEEQTECLGSHPYDPDDNRGVIGFGEDVRLDIIPRTSLPFLCVMVTRELL